MCLRVDTSVDLKKVFTLFGDADSAAVKKAPIMSASSLVWFIHARKRCFKRPVSRLCSRIMMLSVVSVPDFLHLVTAKAQDLPRMRK